MEQYTKEDVGQQVAVDTDREKLQYLAQNGVDEFEKLSPFADDKQRQEFITKYDLGDFDYLQRLKNAQEMEIKKENYGEAEALIPEIEFAKTEIQKRAGNELVLYDIQKEMDMKPGVGVYDAREIELLKTTEEKGAWKISEQWERNPERAGTFLEKSNLREDFEKYYEAEKHNERGLRGYEYDKVVAEMEKYDNIIKEKARNILDELNINRGVEKEANREIKEYDVWQKNETGVLWSDEAIKHKIGEQDFVFSVKAGEYRNGNIAVEVYDNQRYLAGDKEGVLQPYVLPYGKDVSDGKELVREAVEHFQKKEGFVPVLDIDEYVQNRVSQMKEEEYKIMREFGEGYKPNGSVSRAHMEVVAPDDKEFLQAIREDGGKAIDSAVRGGYDVEDFLEKNNLKSHYDEYRKQIEITSDPAKHSSEEWNTANANRIELDEKIKFVSGTVLDLELLKEIKEKGADVIDREKSYGWDMNNFLEKYNLKSHYDDYSKYSQFVSEPIGEKNRQEIDYAMERKFEADEKIKEVAGGKMDIKNSYTQEDVELLQKMSKNEDERIGILFEHFQNDRGKINDFVERVGIAKEFHQFEKDFQYNSRLQGNDDLDWRSGVDEFGKVEKNLQDIKASKSEMERANEAEKKSGQDFDSAIEREIKNKTEKSETEKTKLVVMNENVLGYIHPQTPNTVNFLNTSVERGAYYPYTNEMMIGSTDKVRLATEKDFDVFRVEFSGYKNDKDVEYNRGTEEKVYIAPNVQKIKDWEREKQTEQGQKEKTTNQQPTNMNTSINKNMTFDEYKAKVSIIQVAESLGYQLDKSKGRVTPTYKLFQGGQKVDEIIIKNPDNPNQQHYYDRNRNGGDLIKFVENNLNQFPQAGSGNKWVQINRVLSHYANTEYIAPKEQQPFLKKQEFDPKRYNEWKPESVSDLKFLTQERGLHTETVERFMPYIRNVKDTQVTKPFVNIGFPYGVPGKEGVTNYELRNWNFKGMATGGDKTNSVWIATKATNPNDVKNVHFFESAIDAMSYWEIKRPDLNNTALVSTGGQVSKGQVANTINHFSKAKINTGFDKDITGKMYDVITYGVAIGKDLKFQKEGENFKISWQDKTGDSKAETKSVSIKDTELSLNKFKDESGLKFAFGKVEKAPGNANDWNDALKIKNQKLDLGKESGTKLGIV